MMNTTERKKIKITLKSDLCVGSGYSYAGIIDSDTCYDEIGLPFIPGKRIKGCLREVGEILGKNVDYMFGTKGQSGLKGNETRISIRDAKVENYLSVSNAIKELINNGELTSDDVLDQYSSVKAQTRIDDNGVSNDNSLRFTRTINHFCPRTDNELVFEAEVELLDDSVSKDLEDVVKGLRHIGLNRNRGLGNVKCELVNDEQVKESKVFISDKSEKKQKVKLTYTIRTDSPIMISKNNNDETENYINGQTVLGFFASKYLFERDADDRFDELFVKNGIIFSSLYPSNSVGDVYYPAPGNICKLKKSGYIVNTSIAPPPEESDWKENPGNGNQPKKLKGKFIKIDAKGVAVKEVSTEIIFHHRHEREMEQKLYSESAICAGQYFSGSIIGKYEDIKIIKNIIENSSITFGKSKKAQYGKCSLINGEINDYTKSNASYNAGDRILVTLCSDALFTNELGYTVQADEVRKIIGDALGIVEAKDKDIYTEIDVKELTGYYSVWNLKKQAIPCICAGSTFEYLLEKDCVIDSNTLVGEKCGEGFGVINVKVKDNNWVICKNLIKEDVNIGEHDKEIIKPILVTKKIETIKQGIMRKTNSINKFVLNASTVGRLMLMLNEAVYENKNNIMGVSEALETRINSIKSDKKQDVKNIYNTYYKNILNDVDVNGIDNCAVERLRIFALKEALIMMKYKNKEYGQI